MKKAMKLCFATIGLALCVMTAEAANSITYTVGGWQITLTDLGLLPGGSASSALAINNRGEIVGLATDSTWSLQRPLWDANTGAIIGMADNFDPSSTAVPEHRNDKGEMAGTELINQNLYFGVSWNFTGQAFGLPPMAGVDPLYGHVHVKAHGINNLGQLVGASKTSSPTFVLHAVLWQIKDAAPQDLGFLGKGAYVDYSEAFGINDLGHVVGNSALGTAIRGFLWRDGSMINLSSLSGTVSEGTSAVAVNNNGLVVGRSNIFPVTWKYDVANSSSTPVIQQLPIPTGFFTAVPTAVNDSADVAGYAGAPNIDAHAILWRNRQAVDLGVWPGGHYSVATGINNLGQIVGTGTIAGDNLDHALLWTVVAAGGGAGGGGGTTNATPSASLKATTSTLIRAGRSVSVQASFADPDNGPWSYNLVWGDGSATTGNTSSAGTISGISPHVYTRTGSFKAKLTVTDSKGAAGGSNTITVRVR
jgi:probable HAF family extracellular repeat protein